MKRLAAPFAGVRGLLGSVASLRTASRRSAVFIAPIVTIGCTTGVGTPSPIAADSGYVDVVGARIFYKALGAGEPIIVVHGGPGMDHRYLLPGMRGLARDHRVIVYDQRGGGRTEGNVDVESIRLDAFLSDISAIADTLRLGRFTLLGHSFGGILALQYAARFPERPAALVLMNTSEPGRKYALQTAELLSRRRTTADSVELQQLLRSEELKRRDTSAVNALLRLSFRQLFADRSRATGLDMSLDPRTAGNMSAVASYLVRSMGHFDFWPVAETIRAPTLIVQGIEDASPLEMVRELQRSIRGSELALIADAGHFPYIEQPDATFDAIRRFVAARAAAPRPAP